MNNRAERNKKISQTLKAKRARGEVAGRLPIGFKVVYDDYGRNPRKVVDPNIMSLVLEARKLRAEGMSIRTISKVMAEKGLLSSKGFRLRPSVMQRLLKCQ